MIVPTNLSIALPQGTYGRVAPRSGLAVKNLIDVGTFRLIQVIICYKRCSTPDLRCMRRGYGLSRPSWRCSLQLQRYRFCRYPLLYLVKCGDRCSLWLGALATLRLWRSSNWMTLAAVTKVLALLASIELNILYRNIQAQKYKL